MKTPEIPLEWLPTLPRRYAATVVDWLLVIAAMVVPTALWPNDDNLARVLRVTIAGGALLVYEPLCTGHFVTVGQRVAGVRVRRFDSGEKIGVLRAYGRIVVKGLLGFISFLVLPFTPGRRALHDMATGSIVIMAASEPEFCRWATSGSDAAA